jgi:S-DNA-T family DNA segregation ATPase FtsK/SpoIIIE
VDLWVADQGSTERPAPPYPLLHEGVTDVFAGVPFGVSQRGEVIAPALPGANVAFGGVMGQGKSNAARVVMAGAALDPLAELWVFVFANNGDFDAYQPRLSRYHRGVDEQTTRAAVEALHALYAEVGRREARLAELGAKKVTRPLAEKHPDLRPLVALFSECHELFGDPNDGREAADLAVQTMRRARKTAITLGFDTQSSRADAIPPKIVELVRLNACFAVKSWRSNDGFLGDGSFQAGIRATELRMGKDVGTSILTGRPRSGSRSLNGFTSRPTTTPDSTPQRTSSPGQWPTCITSCRHSMATKSAGPSTRREIYSTTWTRYWEPRKSAPRTYPRCCGTWPQGGRRISGSPGPRCGRSCASSTASRCHARTTPGH